MPADTDLQSLLPEAPPPSQEAKRKALEAANAAFDGNIRAGAQGIGGGARPMDRTGDVSVRKHGARTMDRTRWAAAASLLLAVGLAGGGFFLRDLQNLEHQAEISRLSPGAMSDGSGERQKVERPAPASPPAGDAAMAPAEARPRGIGAAQRNSAARPATQANDSRAAGAAPGASASGSRSLAIAPPGPVAGLRAPAQVEAMAQPSAGMAARDNAPLPPPDRTVLAEDHGRDQFAGEAGNPFRVVREQPVSTFSVDVDTASYSFVRASLRRNVLPPKAAVRTEELVNYFPYAYPAPAQAGDPFRTTVSVLPSPWNEGRLIVHIGIKGYVVQAAERPPANLVFLIDTSGSMNAPDRLPLLKQALAMLVEQLDARDRVAIVTYAGSAGTALEPTPASEKTKILAAIERLGAGGSTAGAEGIRQAYALAEANFDPNGVNRVILGTDGDFNVGITSRGELKGFVERKREKGIFLSVLGFGMGNYNDAMMQALAQNGNGAAAYVDTIAEARKVLIEEASSTIVPIAKDVKIQVEFNPARVAEYRLVGYETRALRREDFTNDKVDAGDVGSGHTVTAIYEIVPAGGRRVNPDLRYAPAQQPGTAAGDELGFLSLRFKAPKSDMSQLMTTAIGAASAFARFDDAPQEARFAVAVAGFGELLRGGRHTGRLTFDEVIRSASAARGEDPFGYRSEFVQLVRAAKTASAMEPLPR